MTKIIKQQRLTRLPSKLRRLVRLTSIVVIMLIPFFYGIISYQFQTSQLQHTADQISDAISKFAYLQPEEWDLQVVRYEHTIADLRAHKDSNYISVLDNAGDQLLSINTQDFMLPISRQSDILSRQGQVGQVIISSSFTSTLLESIGIALLTFFIVTSSLGRISYYSIQGIEDAIIQINQIQLQLMTEQLFMKGILNSSEEIAIIATDNSWSIQYINSVAIKMFNINNDVNLSLQHDLNSSLENHIKQYNQQIELNETDNDEYKFTFELEIDDEVHVIEGRLFKISDENKELYGYTLVCSDITEQIKTSELVQRQALYDSLTNLPNRRLLEDTLEHAVARGKRYNHIGAIFFLDLDNFKNINDSLGHAIGDQVLQEASKRMATHVREEDLVARFGGDEFVILIQEIAETSDDAIKNAHELATKLSQILSIPYEIGEHNLHVTSSIGITVFPNEENEPDAIIQQADTAMYQAKANGRNTVKFFLPSMQHTSELRLQILNDLRRGIMQAEFLPFFQPQFNADSLIIGAEALIRWQHPEKGMIMPGDFISVAEESGLIIELGNLMLKSSLSIMREWLTSGLVSPDFKISINVSPQQFQQAQFTRHIEYILAKAVVPPENLILELTEEVLLIDINSTIKKIQTLKDIGIQFSIDDFGTGYSSLAYLKKLPVNEVKIDREFIRDVLQDDSDAALVEAVVMLSSRLNLNSVAEGVETKEQFEYLKKMKCNIYQGYLFSKPLPKKEFESFYTSHTSC